jgi:NAD(P)H-nitrite reductase large subunit
LLHIVIVGNGVAGITCALQARKRQPDARITVIGEETPYFFSRTALMYALMDQMPRRQLEPYERGAWAAQRIELVHDKVVDMDAGARTLTLRSAGNLGWDKLVLAVGANPFMVKWDGSESVKDGLVNFVSMQDLDACERLFPSTKRAVVVGGGLIGIELVECLRHHDIPTTFVVREDWYWPVALCRDEAKMVAEHMRSHGVDLRLADEMTRMHADADGRVRAIDLAGGDTLECNLLGVAIGVRPATGDMESWTTTPAVDKGILVDEEFRTNLPDVFAIGDCARIQRADGSSLNETIWYAAKRHGGLVGEHALWGDPVRYEPPIFFNSSKFFDIEYTTVGDVARLPAETLTTLLRHPKKNATVRVVHDGERVLGFNMLGARWDHETLMRWIYEKRSAEYVLAHLREAQFDVEFGRLPLQKLERTDSTLGQVNA